MINTRYLCGFYGMFFLLAAYHKAGNERITTETGPQIFVAPSVLTQTATLEMDYMAMPVSASRRIAFENIMVASSWGEGDCCSS